MSVEDDAAEWGWHTGAVRSEAQCWLTDMDGVLVHRRARASRGAAEFLQRLTAKERAVSRPDEQLDSHSTRDLAARLCQGQVSTSPNT